MPGKDEYYNRAKVEGYRARSAFKLKQLDEAAGLFGPGNVVVDLGAAPGGWLQVAAERVGEDGVVIGVDRQRIDALEDVPARVELLRGDITEESTHEEIAEIAAEAAGNDADSPAGDVDVVLSDMAPNVSGEYDLDHARSVHLARQALTVAEAVLAPGGDLVTKVFDGRDLDAFREDVESSFDYARTVVPDATRDSSSEVYIVGKHRLTAPVQVDETYDLEIVDEGSQGDGVAHVEGFTVFVPDADVGETVSVRIDDVKPKFAFAERLE